MSLSQRCRNRITCAAVVLTAGWAAMALAQVTVDPSGRYYRYNGKPVFLIGYYGWASPVDGYFIDHPARYAEMMTQGAPYKLNYIRIGLGGNRLASTTNPPSWNGQPTPVPFPYVSCGGTSKADLNQWDPTYWTGLKAQCSLARSNGFIVHISILDGVGTRNQGGAAYGYAGSMWNPANHCGTFYSDPDSNHNGQIDDSGEFYRVTEFNNGNPAGGTISYYQKRLIDKVTTELESYDNVFYEVGNELMGSDAAWYTAMIRYIQTKTSKPVTQCKGNSSHRATCCLQGWSQHEANTLAELKSNLASIVGYGYPAWEDPDGSQLGYENADGQRRCIWYSFAGGGAAWGGFTTDFWIWPINPPPGFNTAKATYYRNLQNFISDSGVKFWQMVPQHSLVSNSSVNSCTASSGSEYVAYIPSDATATLDLSALSGNAYCRLYDPKVGMWGAQQVVAGGGVRSFTRPSGAADWVIYASASAPVSQTLNIKTAGTVTIDGNPADWNLSEFTTPLMGGQSGSGDYAQVDYQHYASYVGALPTSAADHTARVYVRHDANYLYFLVRCDDTDVQYGNPVGSNWSNDAVEFYIDPSNDGGSSSISNSTSDIQLVIDANNQVNVYMCADAYRQQLLAGLTSAVVRDGTGWWLEARLAKNVLFPAIPCVGTFGLDFNFRDNDNNNDPALTTVYTWADKSGTGFPSKIPDNWADAFVTCPTQTPYPGSEPATVPGVIQAENYDNGGEAIGYHDTSTGNEGGAYRANDVDIEPAADTGGGYSVGWVDPGEWLAYTVNVAAAANYDINVRVASPNGGGPFHLEMNGQNISGALNVPPTGGWQTWTTVTAAGIALNPGRQILKLVADGAGFNVNYIDIEVSVPAPVTWNTLGVTYTVGSGVMPTITTDSQGNVHLIYWSGSALQYKEFNSSMVQLVSETIATPRGAYWMDIKCDSNNVPHIVFSEAVGDPWFPYTNYTYYTNRIGGSWKNAFQVNFDQGKYGPDDMMTCLPTIGLCGSYAYVGTWLTVNAGKIVRLSNLGAQSPTPDATAYTVERSTIAVNSACHVFAVGRNTGASRVEEFDSNLNPVTSSRNVFFSYAGAPHIAWAEDSLVHFLSWERVAGQGAAFPCADVSGITYNNTGRRNPDYSFQPAIQGLPGGPAGTGPLGNEPTGWWNDDVAPAMAVDAHGTVYIAWRFWSPAGPGMITKVDNSGFTQSCSVDPTCGGNICTGTQFAPSLPRRRWWNCDLAPADGGGVYVAYENGGSLYIRGVGVQTDATPPGPIINFTATPRLDSINLSWTNSTDADCAGVRIVFKTTGYPTGLTDGTLLVEQAGAPGSAGQYVHAGMGCGTPHYYAAFSYDQAANYNTTAVPKATARIQCADFDLDQDVDQDDFGFFQRCLSGDGIGYGQDCAPADLNSNGDVDQTDFNLFRACMGGAGRTPGC